MITLDVNGRAHRSTPIRTRRCSTCCATISSSTAPSSAAGSASAAPARCCVDGKAVFSCLTPIVGACRPQAITTIEGLGTADKPGPLQRAFIEEQAAQCGYCIAGMMMRAQALLERNPSHLAGPEIRAHMAPNLCRCGTHMRILRAVRRAADDDAGRAAARRVREGGARDADSDRDAAWRRPRRRADRQLLAVRGAACGQTPRPAGPRCPAASKTRRCSTPGSASTPTAAITVFTGKAELGQGIKTALIQVAAEELAVAARPHHARHRRHRRARRTRATPPAANRCRTAAPRSATRPRRCA